MTLEIAAQGKRATDVSEELRDQIKAAIYSFSGQMPLATAIGVLEIVKKEILEESANEH